MAEMLNKNVTNGMKCVLCQYNNKLNDLNDISC